jgi:uncharacterized membrane protein
MKQIGRTFFALGIISLGIISIYLGDFIVGRPPSWPWNFPGWTTFSYISAGLLIVAGIAVLFKWNAGYASLVICALIFMFAETRHVASMFHDWGSASKILALCGGALLVAISFFGESDQPQGSLGLKIQNDKFVLAGILPMALFLILCCVLHFMYAGFVDSFIPAYIPVHTFWTYFTAIALLAGGGGIVIKRTRRLAALLSGAMIFGWFILLHIPRTVAAPHDKYEWMGVFESLAFSGILFVLADRKSRVNGQ